MSWSGERGWHRVDRAVRSHRERMLRYLVVRGDLSVAPDFVGTDWPQRFPPVLTDICG